MARISYSQFSQWDKCPHMWKLNYVDKVGEFSGNIYTIFGTAIHETIQAYLVAYYDKTIKVADSFPLTDIFKRIATASESFMKWLGEHEHLSVKIFK